MKNRILAIPLILLALLPLACTVTTVTTLDAAPTMTPPTETEGAPNPAAAFVLLATITPAPTPEPSLLNNGYQEEPPTQAAQPCRVKTGIDAGLLNLRSGPGISYPVLQVLQEGETLTVLEHGGGWVSVTTQAGEPGWIYGRFITCPSLRP